MLKKITAEGVGLEPKYELEFGSRLNLFTGDNGLGKTFMLELAWWSITGTAKRPGVRTRDDVDEPYIKSEFLIDNLEHTVVSKYNRTGFSWLTPSFRPYGADICIFASGSGTFDVWDIRRKIIIENEMKSKAMMGPVGIPVPSSTYSFSTHTLLNGLTDSSNSKVQCRGLIADLVEWQTRTDRARWSKYLQEMLAFMSPPGESMKASLIERLYADDVREIPAINFPYGEVPIAYCSSAVLRILSLVYLLVWSYREHIQLSALSKIEPGTNLTIIIDEIELHLHPRWQRTILRTLLHAAKILHPDIKTQIITTTHAPLILASAEPLIDEASDRLYLFEQDASDVTLRQLPWIKEGDVSAWLSSEVFKLEEARSIEAEIAIAHAEDYMRKKSSKTFSQIQLELEQVLNTRDPFWSKWLLQQRIENDRR